MDLILLLSTHGIGAVKWLIPFALAGIIGYGVYTSIWSRYRNADATYHYETAPGVQVANLETRDDWSESRSRLRDEHIHGYGTTKNPRHRI